MASVALVGLMNAGQLWAFNLDDVAAKAKDLAGQKYEAPKSNLPAAFRDMKFADYQKIHFLQEKAEWAKDKTPFKLSFYHQGMHFDTPVKINEVTASKVEEIKYDPSRFEFGDVPHDPETTKNLGYAGFRVLYPINKADKQDEIMTLLGASYFRVVGKGHVYGLSARGLAIDTALPSGEEFPRFTEFWVEKPKPTDKHLVIYALLDSPRSTGAYKLTLRPGTDTIVDVKSRVYLRDHVSRLGIAPLTSMFLFGENQPRKDDFRPEVHDSDGLMVATGEGEWLWRPLQNPKQPLVTSVATTNPQGFGLMQRDRQWASYEDVEARYERRPSAWVRPLHDWGAGRVELVQLNTPDETHDNIVAYWVPAQMPAPGQPLEFAYELSWQGDEQQRPPGAWATQSRRGVGYTKETAAALRQQAQYVVDFDGPALKALPADATVKAVVTSDANGKVLENIVYRNPATEQWRMTVRVQRQKADRPIELRAFLQHDNNAVSETWTHIILPE